MNALGVDAMTNSGMWKVPVQITTTVVAKEKSTTDMGLSSLKPVLEVIKKINTELNLRKLITMILDTAIEFCNAQRGTIVVFEGEKFKIELSRDRQKHELKRLEMGVSRTVLKLVRDSGKRVIAEDARQDPTLRIIDSVQDQSLLSILCRPLRVKMRLIGAVYLDNSQVVGAFGPREIEIAEILTDHGGGDRQRPAPHQGDPRHPDEPLQPRPLREAARKRGRPLAPPRPPLRRADDGHRRLQEDQRHPRPRRRQRS